ncbi:MAG: sugar isomerase, partial [bacterium]|nr:sugar isomerase [bacterium]
RPDFAAARWLGFKGEIVDNPFMAICRSQIDVKIQGDCQRLAAEMRGFHWMTGYGDYLDELGYALKKVGVDWMNISA